MLFRSVVLPAILAATGAVAEILANNTINGVSPELYAEFEHAAKLSLTAFPKCANPLGNKKLAQFKGASTGYVSVDQFKRNIIVVMRGSSKSQIS
jgi:hypothetical protein